MEWLIDFFQNVDYSSIFLAQWNLGEGHSQWDLGKGHFSTACGFDSLEYLPLTVLVRFINEVLGLDVFKKSTIL